MSVDEKLELIEVYRRITALENKVFKWKRRRVWMIENFEIWMPAAFMCCICGYLGFVIGMICYSRPY